MIMTCVESWVMIAAQAEKIIAFPALVVHKVTLYDAIHIQIIPNMFEQVHVTQNQTIHFLLSLSLLLLLLPRLRSSTK